MVVVVGGRRVVAVGAGRGVLVARLGMGLAVRRLGAVVGGVGVEEERVEVGEEGRVRWGWHLAGASGAGVAMAAPWPSVAPLKEAPSMTPYFATHPLCF